MQFIVCSVQLAVCILECLQSEVCSLHCTVYSLKLAVCSLQCAVYSLQCAVYSVQCVGLGTFRLFRSVLGRGPSAKSFLSLSLFLYHSIMFRSVPFCSVLSRRTVFPFRSVPFLAFLFKKRFHSSRSVLSQRTFPSPLFRS